MLSSHPDQPFVHGATEYRAGEDSTTEDGSIASLASGLGVSPAELASRPKIPSKADCEMVDMSRGISLLLVARERVLSLSEQRVRFPIVPTSGCPL